jgi:N-acetylglucosaminyl-diphospho-decaprenol L-rhamnosyltransferase
MLSYCVTATNARDAAVACVESIERSHPDGVEREILVLDNASDDATAEALAGRGGVRVLRQERRAGAAENRNALLHEARGELCLLLDEDTEVPDRTVAALVAALEADAGAAVAGPQLVYPDGSASPCAWRLPGVGTALAQLFFVGGVFVTESGGSGVRGVGWVQSAAMLVRREAVLAIGGYDEEFFLYSDETDLQKRLHDAGWRVLHVSGAVVVHHEQLSSGGDARRIVQFHRGRDLYMRKHHSGAAVVACRMLWSLSYLMRTAIAMVRPGAGVGPYLLHARQALRPWRGEGIAEAALAFNAGAEPR